MHIYKHSADIQKAPLSCVSSLFHPFAWPLNDRTVKGSHDKGGGKKKTKLKSKWMSHNSADEVGAVTAAALENRSGDSDP